MPHPGSIRNSNHSSIEPCAQCRQYAKDHSTHLRTSHPLRTHQETASKKKKTRFKDDYTTSSSSCSELSSCPCAYPVDSFLHDHEEFAIPKPSPIPETAIEAGPSGKERYVFKQKKRDSSRSEIHKPRKIERKVEKIHQKPKKVENGDVQIKSEKKEMIHESLPKRHLNARSIHPDPSPPAPAPPPPPPPAPEQSIIRSEFRDIETQTLKSGTNSKLAQLGVAKKSLETKTFQSLSNFKKQSVTIGRFKCGKLCGVCPFPLWSGILWATYIFLILIAIVITAALSQRRGETSRAADVPRQTSRFPGARQVNAAGVGNVRRGRVRTTSTRGQGQPRVRQLRPLPRRLVPVVSDPPVLKELPRFFIKHNDFDYFDQEFRDLDFALGGEEFPHTQINNRPITVAPLPAFVPAITHRPPVVFHVDPKIVAHPIEQAPIRPVPVQHTPVQRAPTTFVSSPRQPAPPTNRRKISIARHEFSDATANVGSPTRGQKQPEVKIVKSWSVTNVDGTYSWGYINTDGSFKNETKGNDCVVRGAYGYVDEATGQLLTFPYETGIPCDPNAVEEPFVDYDYTLSLREQIPAPQRRRQSARQALRA